MEQLFFIKTNFVKNGCSFSNERLPIVPGIKLFFEHSSVRKNPISSSCFCFSLSEIDQKFEFAGNIGYRDWYLAFLIRPFKVIRLQAILQDTARAVWAHSS